MNSAILIPYRTLCLTYSVALNLLAFKDYQPEHRHHLFLLAGGLAAFVTGDIIGQILTQRRAT